MVGDRRGRAFAVAFLPQSPQIGEVIAPAEPVVERGVHRHGEIRRDRALADRVGQRAVVGRKDEDAGGDLLAGADVGHDGLDVVGREPVDDCAVAFASRESQHALA